MSIFLLFWTQITPWSIFIRWYTPIYRGGSRRVAKILSESNTFHIKARAIKMLSCKNFATLIYIHLCICVETFFLLTSFIFAFTKSDLNGEVIHHGLYVSTFQLKFYTSNQWLSCTSCIWTSRLVYSICYLWFTQIIEIYRILDDEGVHLACTRLC